MASSEPGGPSNAAEAPRELTAWVRSGLARLAGPRPDWEWSRVPADGSQRRFWRVGVRPGPSVMVMANPPVEPAAAVENRAYLHIGRHLARRGLPVPAILTADLPRGWFLIEDLGPEHLQQRRFSTASPVDLYRQVLERLLALQIEGAADFDPAWCCQTPCYDRAVMLNNEAHYFRDAFLKRHLGLAERSGLEAAFAHAADRAAQAPPVFFLHRDCQSRNILMDGARLGFIDWQGGRLGPLGYDLASLLIDPYATLGPDARALLAAEYAQMVRQRSVAWYDDLALSFPYLALQRNLQILGAFAFLSDVRGRPFFAQFIGPAVETLGQLLQASPDAQLAPLRELVREIGEEGLLGTTGPVGPCEI